MTEFEEIYRNYFRDVYPYLKSLTNEPYIAEENYVGDIFESFEIHRYIPRHLRCTRLAVSDREKLLFFLSAQAQADRKIRERMEDVL